MQKQSQNMEEQVEMVGRAFVEHYYHLFDTDRSSLASLCHQSSMLTFEGQNLQGGNVICSKIKQLPFDKCHHLISTIDSQPSSFAGGIVVFVSGSLQLADEEHPLRFSQMFHLIPTPQGSFYVQNDMFRLNYGLKINVQKSKILGICVPFNEVERVAGVLGCVAIKTPFVYPGVKVGAGMSKLQAWDGTHKTFCFADIVQACSQLRSKGLNLLGYCKRSVGDGRATWFSKNLWNGEMLLKDRFPRLFLLENAQEALVAEKCNSSWDGMFKLRLGYNVDGEFTVNSARRLIDSVVIWQGNTATRWVKLVPIKVNVFCWKMFLNGIPTCSNMSKRGIDLEYIKCPICDNKIEEVDHLFSACTFAQDLSLRNKNLFGFSLPKKSLIFDEIVSQKKSTMMLDWWVFNQNPKLVLMQFSDKSNNP
ncbi:hypothetical protein LXL04_034696 [Taraxacum kok-saghyz]